jgi:hypothetical protein
MQRGGVAQLSMNHLERSSGLTRGRNAIGHFQVVVLVLLDPQLAALMGVRHILFVLRILLAGHVPIARRLRPPYSMYMFNMCIGIYVCDCLICICIGIYVCRGLYV